MTLLLSGKPFASMHDGDMAGTLMADSEMA